MHINSHSLRGHETSLHRHLQCWKRGRLPTSISSQAVLSGTRSFSSHILFSFSLRVRCCLFTEDIPTGGFLKGICQVRYRSSHLRPSCTLKSFRNLQKNNYTKVSQQHSSSCPSAIKYLAKQSCILVGSTCQIYWQLTHLF